MRPELVGEVAFTAWTRDGRLRHPAWKGCARTRSPPTSGGSPVADPARVTVDVGARQLSLSNLGKQLYPDGTTKGQVLDYYRRVAPALLPHLRGRPLTMKRYPHGTDGSFFYEKTAPRGRPAWVRTVTLPAPGSTRSRETIDYVVCDDLATLVWCANLASIELHTPQYRVSDGGEPMPSDQLVLDLDPGAPLRSRSARGSRCACMSCCPGRSPPARSPRPVAARGCRSSRPETGRSTATPRRDEGAVDVEERGAGGHAVRRTPRTCG